MKWQRNNIGNKGFTLVELLVALLISGILLATVSSVFLMSQKLYIRGENISYKQKSITNVETELQNALARSISVTLSDNPTGNFNLGFDVNGRCVEKIGAGEDFEIDQITEIALYTGQNTLYYELIPKNSMSILSGGIMINNRHNPNFVLDSRLNVSEDTRVSLQGNKPCYLVIIYATGN